MFFMIVLDPFKLWKYDYDQMIRIRARNQFYSLQCVKMEVLTRKICTKHNMEAHKICTSLECFQQKDILVCPNCSTKHISRNCEVIDVSLLNQKVHDLMKKRVEFQSTYNFACEEWLNEFRKFKVFKEELMSILNIRERHLNDICRKIRRTIPYEKDRQLFKKTLSYLHLSTRAINPNYQLYQKFNDALADTINDVNRTLHKLRLNRNDIPLLFKKEHQICSVLKELGDVTKPSVPCTKYTEPVIGQFKKETIKYNKLVQAENIDSSLYRIGDEDFIAFNSRSKVIHVYNHRNLALPKTLYIGSEVQHLQVLGKNLFITNQNSNIFIYDLLNEKILKEYTSSNHKNAKITSLLAIDRQIVLNFVHNPNQIVALAFDESKMTLKVSKGVQTKNKCLASINLNDQFIASFEDKSLRLFNSLTLQKISQYQIQSPARSLSVMDSQTILAGGESQFVYLLDKRAHGLAGKFNMQSECSGIKKIYPTTLIANLGNCLKLYEYRMQKQLIKIGLDSPVREIEVLNSLSFVTSGKQLSFYEGIA